MDRSSSIYRLVESGCKRCGSRQKVVCIVDVSKSMGRIDIQKGLRCKQCKQYFKFLSHREFSEIKDRVDVEYIDKKAPRKKQKNKKPIFTLDPKLPPDMAEMSKGGILLGKNLFALIVEKGETVSVMR